MSEKTIAPDTDLVQESERLQPLLFEHAQRNEEQGRIAQEVIDSMHETGILRIWLPAALGGAELSPRASLRVLANLSYADPGAAWVVMATGMITGTTAAYIGDQAADALFGSGEFQLIAGQGTRMGSARTTEGGYLLSGDWQFASGVKHARYIHTAAVVEETGEAKIFTLPVEQVALVDNWNVLGLRATGSIDYSIRDTFVPEAYTYDIAIQEPLRGGSIYKLGTANFAGICHAGWTLGVGRRLLDEVAAHARDGKGRAGQRRDNAAFHAEYAATEAAFRAAEALLFQTWADIEENLAADEPLSTRQETLARLALNHLTWTTIDVAQFALKATATLAIRDGVINRYIRDMQTASTHVTSSQPVLEACGRELLGTEPRNRWVFLDFVDVGA